MNIDLSEYQLCRIEEINKRQEAVQMTELTLDGDHTFILNINDDKILTKNCDGFHIQSLLINLFYKWFSYLIEKKIVKIIQIPIIAYRCEGRRGWLYSYSLQDFNKKVESGMKVIGKPDYLKGLGTLDDDRGDWQWVFKNMQTITVREDGQSSKYLDIAFGPNAHKRKTWLQTDI